VVRCPRDKRNLVRYADDFLIMVQKQSDACIIDQALRDRFKKFSITLHPEKTRTISFSRKEPENAKRQGRKPYTFEFLGFTHYWFRTREGWYVLSRRTSVKRFRRACQAMNEWLRSVRNWCKTKEWWLILVRLHYQNRSDNILEKKHSHDIPAKLSKDITF